MVLASEQTGCTLSTSRKTVTTIVCCPREKHQCLEVCHARLPHTDRRAVKWFADKVVVLDMDMPWSSVVDDFGLCAEGTMTNTRMPSMTNVGDRPGALIHIDFAAMNVLSISGAK